MKKIILMFAITLFLCSFANAFTQDDITINSGAFFYEFFNSTLASWTDTSGSSTSATIGNGRVYLWDGSGANSASIYQDLTKATKQIVYEFNVSSATDNANTENPNIIIRPGWSNKEYESNIHWNSTSNNLTHGYYDGSKDIRLFGLINGTSYIVRVNKLNDTSTDITAYYSTNKTMVWNGSITLPTGTAGNRTILRTGGNQLINYSIGYFIACDTTNTEECVSFADIGTSSFIPPTPSDGYTNNQLDKINVTCTTLPGNVYLWFDTNPDPVTTVLNNVPVNSSSVGANWTINISTNGKYYYKAGCGASNSTVRTWTFDNNTPTVILNSNNYFGTANGTAIGYSAAVNALINFSLSDNIAVYGFELNITNSTGGTVYNLTNITSSGTYTNFSKYVNVGGQSGWYLFNITVWDTHTTTSIEDYKLDKGSNYLKFDNIKITAENAIAAESIRKTDRYQMQFDYGSAPDEKIFYLESDGNLDYIANSPYKAHFVDWKNKRWVDFEGLSGYPSVSKISDTKWQVTYYSNKDSIVFNSIGGLNWRTYIYNYTIVTDVGNSWLVPSNNYLPLYNQSYPAFVSWNVTTNYQNLTFIRLYLSNHTLLQTYNASGIGGALNTLYNHTFEGLNSSLSYFINATHYDTLGNSVNSSTLTVSGVGPSNCSVKGYPSINYTLYNSTTNTKIVGTINLLFTYHSTDPSSGITYYQNYSTTTYASNISVCIFPNSSSVVSDVLADYYINVADLHYSNFLEGITLNNITKTQSIYTSDNAQQVQFSVKDNEDNDVSGAVISVQKYDVGTNTYTEVERPTTDNSGFAYATIILYNTWYRFVIYYNGVAMLSDGPTKVISTTKNFRINLLGPNWFDNFIVSNGVEYTLYFTNTTLKYTFTYNDPNLLIDDACLKVKNLNGTQVFLSCSTAHSGTIVSDAVNPVGTYIGTGYINIGQDSFILNISEVTFPGTSAPGQLAQTMKDTSFMGVFVTFMLFVAIVTVGIWHPIVAVTLSILVIAVVRAMGFYIMSWSVFVALIVMGVITIVKMQKAD